METQNKYLITGIMIIILSALLPVVIAQNGIEEENIMDYPIFGFELEKLLSLLNGIIGLTLSIITFIAYKTDGRIRFLYVSIAFLIFSTKSFLISSEIFFSGLDWRDPLSIVLEFFVLAAFFYGVIKKGG